MYLRTCFILSALKAGVDACRADLHTSPRMVTKEGTVSSFIGKCRAPLLVDYTCIEEGNKYIET